MYFEQSLHWPDLFSQHRRQAALTKVFPCGWEKCHRGNSTAAFPALPPRVILPPVMEYAALCCISMDSNFWFFEGKDTAEFFQLIKLRIFKAI